MVMKQPDLIRKSSDFSIVIVDKGIPIYRISRGSPMEILEKAFRFIQKKYQTI